MKFNMKILVFIIIAPFVTILSLVDLIVMVFSLCFLIFRNNDINKYIYRNFLSIDQRLNTLFFGDEDETISSRMGKSVVRHDNWLSCFICKILNLIDKNHCIKSIEYDENVD